MELNTGFNDLVGCPLSLHKIQVDPLSTDSQAVGFGNRAFEVLTASSLT